MAVASISAEPWIAEEAVLGCLLADPDGLQTAASLTAAHFHRERNANLFGAILAVHSAGKPVDVITVASELEAMGELERCGGRAQLALLRQAVYSSHSIGAYVAQMDDDLRRRRQHEVLTQAAQRTLDRRHSPEAALRVVLDSAPLAASTPDVARVGLGYRLTFGQAGVEILVSRLRESRGELTAEIAITSRRSALDFADGHIHSSRFNLTSISARNTLATTLDKRVKGDWSAILERLCLAIVQQERRSQPVQLIGRLPRRPAPPKLLDPLLPLGQVSVVFAPGGVGKSTLAAAIAVTVASGEPVISGWSATRAPVLVLDYETTGEEWNDRVAAIAEGAGIDPPDITYRGCSKPLADDIEAVAAFATECRAGLVIVDSVGIASGSSREGSDANESTVRLFAALRSLGVTVLLVDHVKGEDLQTSGPNSKPYGSIYKVNLARSVWELRREKDAVGNRSDLLLLHVKVNDGPKHAPIGLTVDYSGDAIAFDLSAVEAPDLAGALPLRERMARVLRSGAQPAARIAEELGVPDAHIRSLLSRHSDMFTRLPDHRIGLVGRG